MYKHEYTYMNIHIYIYTYIYIYIYIYNDLASEEGRPPPPHPQSEVAPTTEYGTSKTVGQNLALACRSKTLKPSKVPTLRSATAQASRDSRYAWTFLRRATGGSYPIEKSPGKV